MNHFIDFANVTNSTPALFCLIRLIYEFVVPGIRSTSLLWYLRAAHHKVHTKQRVRSERGQWVNLAVRNEPRIVEYAKRDNQRVNSIEEAASSACSGRNSARRAFPTWGRRTLRESLSGISNCPQIATQNRWACTTGCPSVCGGS